MNKEQMLKDMTIFLDNIQTKVTIEVAAIHKATLEKDWAKRNKHIEQCLVYTNELKELLKDYSVMLKAFTESLLHVHAVLDNLEKPSFWTLIKSYLGKK